MVVLTWDLTHFDNIQLLFSNCCFIRKLEERHCTSRPLHDDLFYTLLTSILCEDYIEALTQLINVSRPSTVFLYTLQHAKAFSDHFMIKNYKMNPIDLCYATVPCNALDTSLNEFYVLWSNANDRSWIPEREAIQGARIRGPEHRGVLQAGDSLSKAVSSPVSKIQKSRRLRRYLHLSRTSVFTSIPTSSPPLWLSIWHHFAANTIQRTTKSTRSCAISSMTKRAPKKFSKQLSWEFQTSESSYTRE